MISLIRRLQGRFGRDASFVLLARLLQNANGFLLSVLIVRQFGLAAAGTLTVATIPIVVLALLGTGGLTYTLARMELPTPQRNAIGLAMAVAIVPLSLPFTALLALIAGHSPTEMLAIVLLSLGGPFFAQTNIANALQVLQNRLSHSVIPPLGNLIGLMLATAFSHTLVGFAAVLATARFAAILITFLTLPRMRVPLRETIRHIREGLRFLTADGINLGTDQATVLLVSLLMDRDSLGLFGLCRQMLTVSDTPGWSQMQAVYPAMVANPDEVMPAFRRRMLRLGAACGAIVAALSVAAALFIYHLPPLAIFAPLLLSSVPLRYLLGVYDMRLRAIGAVARANTISLVRAALAVAIIPTGALVGGVTGAILATMLHSALAVWLTSRSAIQNGRTPEPQRLALSTVSDGRAAKGAVP